MIRFSKIWILFICLALLQSCTTMYNTKIIKIEVKLPGRAKIPNDYKKIAIRYNNSNVASNPVFNYYFEDDIKLPEITNIDSIASEIYFQLFTEQLKKQQFFDTIIELKPVDFSEIALSDSLIYRQMVGNDSTQVEVYSGVNSEVYNFARFVKKYTTADSNKNVILLIDPEYGLYTKRQIQNIANSTGADLFLSLDFFSSVDGIYLYESRMAHEKVYTLACWNVYDLKKVNFERTLQKLDTIQWMEPVYSLKEAKRMLPPRKDAVLNAADYDFNHVVKSTVFMTDLSHFAEMNEIYAKHFVEPFPARSTIQVSALPKGSMIEIEVIAVK